MNELIESVATLRIIPIPVNITERQRENFWAKVNKTESCWLWTGCRKKTRGEIGYGIFQISTKSFLSHRVSWCIKHGEIPKGMFVLHNCPGGDNKACVNPDHLWLGTIQDNCLDMVKKGGHGSRTMPERMCRGEGFKSSKMTEAKVLELRRSYAAKEGTHQMLADKFGISQSAVTLIVTGRRWRHVTMC